MKRRVCKKQGNQMKFQFRNGKIDIQLIEILFIGRIVEGMNLITQVKLDSGS